MTSSVRSFRSPRGIVVLAFGVVALTVSAGGLPTAPSWLLAGGLVCGFMAGLLGIGGALVSVPVFYLALPALGVQASALPHAVLAAALLAMLPTTLAVGWAQHRGGVLSHGWLARLAPGMAVGAFFGALLATQLRGIVLQSAFAAQALCYGLCLICRAPRPHRPAPQGARRCPSWIAGPAAAALGASCGMGVGSLIVPYLVRRGVDLRHAVATAGALNVCIAVGGSAAFWIHARAAAPLPAAVWPAAVVLGAAATFAVPTGVAWAGRLRPDRLRQAVGAIFIAGALSLLANALT